MIPLYEARKIVSQKKRAIQKILRVRDWTYSLPMFLGISFLQGIWPSVDSFYYAGILCTAKSRECATRRIVFSSRLGAEHNSQAVLRRRLLYASEDLIADLSPRTQVIRSRIHGGWVRFGRCPEGRRVRRLAFHSAQVRRDFLRQRRTSWVSFTF